MNLEQAAWIAALVSVPIAALSAVVATFARRDAKQSARAAERSARAAEDLTEIEQRRRYEEMTPQLSVEAACWGPGNERLRLTVRLDGPPGLDGLDEVAIRVRDDHDRSPVTAGGPTREQIAETIWGPYRFVPSVDGADRLGREVAAFPLKRGESRLLVMEPTQSPPWVSTPDWWRREYADDPIRLEAACVRDDDLVWRQPLQVDPPQPSFAAVARPSDRAVKVMARNVGTAPAREVRWRPPPTDPTLIIKSDEVSTLDVEHSTSAFVLLVDQSTAEWVELTWTDHLGVSRSQRVDLDGL